MANVRPSLTARNHGIEILAQRRAVQYGRPAFHAECCYMETLTGRRAQRANSRRNRPTLRDEIGFVLQFVSWVVYFSPRLLCRFDLLGRAISIRRRIASDREGLSFCCLAQVSIADRVLGGSRTVRTGS